MTESDWRQTICDRLNERNKHESSFHEIILNSQCLCYSSFVFYVLMCIARCVRKITCSRFDSFQANGFSKEIII